MVMVMAWAPERAEPLPGAPGAGELPGQPRQAASRTTAARSARRTGGRIGAGEHATGRGAGKHDVCAASHGGPGEARGEHSSRSGRGAGVASTGRTTGEGP